MARYPFLLLTLMLLALTGCNQGSEAPAEEVLESPMTEQEPPTEAPTEAPTEDVMQELADEAAAALTEAAEAEIPNLNLCTDPRPEICTQDYTPVCGVHEDGSRQTYSNGCTACSNAEVVGSLPGPCPE